MRHDFNPFSKGIGDIEPADLAVLRDVTEGWYVEYKREVSNAGAVAKSISALANTYGGWIFYGVAEKSKDEAVAGEFPGIPRQEADALLQRIRQSAANHLQPTPYFETKALFGPAPDIGLPEDRCVVVVRVPWGPDAPFIHKDGRIYRRVADGSEPRHETDRYILDQLAARSSKITDHFAEWTSQGLETSEAEGDVAHVRIFLIADFWGDHEPVEDVPIGKIREIMRDTSGDFALSFDNVYRTTGAYVCRQAQMNDPQSLTLTWTLRTDFCSEIVIPLPKFRGGNLASLHALFRGYDHADRFIRLCRQQHYKDPTVIDLNLLMIILMALARKHLALAKQFGWTEKMSVKVRIAGVWRTIPFFDAPHVLDEYEQHGLALNLRDEASVHPGKSHHSYFNLAAPEAEGTEQSNVIWTAISLFVPIARALGVSMGMGDEEDYDTFKTSIVDFVMAGQRAIGVQKTRNGDSPS
jgi:hypothetical protein